MDALNSGKNALTALEFDNSRAFSAQIVDIFEIITIRA